MRQRNWNDLSRKLVDRTDLTYTLSGMSEILGKYALTFFGEGVKITTTFPNPFPIVLSAINLTATVGTGIAYDYLGNFTSIAFGTGLFTIGAGVSQARWDLLVIRYIQTGDTSIPKPSDPLTMINLNLHDDYELVLIEGAPSGSPAYPAKNTQDIILAGIQVPISATLANQCTVDLSVRELGFADTAKYATFKQELLTGTVDGVNTTFTTSLTPIATSVLVSLDGSITHTSSEFTISGNTITFLTAPTIGQEPYCYYIVLNASSVNPTSATQEIPSGTIDGTNATFNLVGKPLNKDSTVVYLNGLIVTSDLWSLVQGPTITSILFNTAPVIGQSPYVFYFTKL